MNVLTLGVFDCFHLGHVELLRRARRLGTRLVVGVNTDELNANYKPPCVMNQDERLAVVRACRYVDEAILQNDPCVIPIIRDYGIKIIVHGDDTDAATYAAKMKTSERELWELGVRLIMLPYTRGISTTEIRERTWRSANAGR